MADFGPNRAAVGSLIGRAGMLLHDEAMDLFESRAAWFETRSEGYDERDALRAASRVAARSGRAAAYESARREAAAAFRKARRGEVGPWLSVAKAVSNAAGALVLSDLLDRRDYQLLYGPWHQAIGEAMVPVGPGPVAATQRRRRVVAG
jgi:hypothetical protein